MSDNEQLDVLIAVYLIPDLAQQDFDAYVKLAGDGEIVTDGVALVLKDADGEVQVQETGDHLGRKGAKIGGGAASSSGSSPRRFWRRPPSAPPPAHWRGSSRATAMQAGIGEKMDDALPPGSAGIIAIYDHDGADAVAGALGERDPHLDRPDRQGVSRRAESRPGGGIGGTRGLRKRG